MVLALPELAWLALLLLAFGIVYALRKFIEGLFNPLIAVFRPIPGVGSAISGVLHAIEQSISHALGSAEHEIDRAIGASFHLFARYADKLWQEIASNATLAFQEVDLLAHALYRLSGLRSLVHHTIGLAHSAHRLIKTLEREWHGIEHRVKTLEHDLSKGIGHDLRVEIRSLDKELHQVTTKTIPAIQAADAQAESAISDLWTWVHRNVAIPGTRVFTGAVAVALAALGLGGLRCPGFLNFLNKRGCGLGRLLDDLLGIMIAGLVLESVCEFLPVLEDAFGAVAGPITHLLTEVPLGACEVVPDKWATLSVQHGPLPPAQTLGAFPV